MTTTQKPVIIGGQEIYQEIQSKKGFIPNHKWNIGDTQAVFILKAAKESVESAKTIPNKLPSWVLVEELLGTTISVTSIGVQGQHEYDVTKSAKENFDALIEVVSDEDLAQNKLCPKDIRTREEIKAWVNENWDKIVEDFNYDRTTMKIVVGRSVETRVPKWDRSILEPQATEEDMVSVIKEVNDYHYICKALLEAKFRRDNRSLAPGTDEYSNSFDAYQFKEMAVSRVRDRAFTYVVYSKLQITRSERKLVEDNTYGGPNQLASYELSSTKNTKLLSAILGAVKVHLDYYALEFYYSKEADKMTSGKNLNIQSSMLEIEENKIFEYFQGAIRDDAFNKVSGTNIVKPEEIARRAQQYAINMADFFKTIPGETREKLNQELLSKLEVEAKNALESEDYIAQITQDAAVAPSVPDFSSEGVNIGVAYDLPEEKEVKPAEQPKVEEVKPAEQDQDEIMAAKMGIPVETYRAIKYDNEVQEI